jgi:hypothetical protein
VFYDGGPPASERSGVFFFRKTGLTAGENRRHETNCRIVGSVEKKVAGIPEKPFEVVGIFYFVYEYKPIKQIPDRTLGRFR